MSRARRILIAGVGLVLVGFAVGEHLSRRLVEHRYQQALEARRQLERQAGTIISHHNQLAANLTQEQRRSQELSEALASTRGQLEEVVGRLAQESKSVRELQLRLAAMQSQMDQLQGELAMTLQERERTTSAQPSPVQLERVVVTDPSESGLRGRVLSVHRDWNFVVIDLGWNDVKIGETLSIFRNDRLLAKARIERVQEQVCAATVLPEWSGAEIQVNDLARIL